MTEICRAWRNIDIATLHIIDRKTQHDPYVVCWNFDGREWDWGTYLQNIDAAWRVFEEKRKVNEFSDPMIYGDIPAVVRYQTVPA